MCKSMLRVLDSWFSEFWKCGTMMVLQFRWLCFLQQWWFVDKKGSWKTDRVRQCWLHCIQIIESNGGIWQWSSQPKLTGLQQLDISCFTAVHYIRPERKVRIFFTRIPSHNTRVYQDPRSIVYMVHEAFARWQSHLPIMLKQTSNVSCLPSISFHHCLDISWIRKFKL